MNRPGEGSEKSNPPSFWFFHPEKAQQFSRKEEQGQSRGQVPEDTGEMIPVGSETECGVIERVGQSLDRPIEIGSRRVRKKEMLKPFGNQAPAANKRVAQNEAVSSQTKPFRSAGA